MLHQKFYQHFSYSVDKHQLYSAKKEEKKKKINCVTAKVLRKQGGGKCHQQCQK